MVVDESTARLKELRSLIADLANNGVPSIEVAEILVKRLHEEGELKFVDSESYNDWMDRKEDIEAAVKELYSLID